MTKKMLIDAAHQEEVRVCVLQDGKVEDFDFESSSRKPLRGNIYLARVTRVEPSLQAAFVEYGGNRHGFLAFSEIHPDYYQIPVSDRQAIQDAEAEEAALAEELDLAHRGDEDDEDDDGHHHDDIPDDEGEDIEASGDVDDVDEPNADEADTDDNAKLEASDDSSDKTGDVSEPDASEDQSADVDAENVDEDGDDDGGDGNDSDDDPYRTVNLDSDEPKLTADPEDYASEDNIDEDDADEDGDADDDEPGDEDDEIAASEDDGENDENSVSAASDDGDVADDEAGEVSEGADEDAGDEEQGGDIDGEEDSDEENTPSAKAKRAELLERYKEARRKRARLVRSYKIQEVIKRRQILLIQVVKEERGNKGAALTTYLSLAGRYCVLMPNTARGGGISRKIPNSSDRKRLRRVVDGLDVGQGMGLIIRTAGAKRTKAEIKRDYEYLTRLWETIRSLTLKSIAPCLIYEEASLIKRAIRDLYDKDISTVIVEGEAGYREAKDFMKMLMPSHAKNVQPYKEKLPLFVRHDVEAQLDAMYQPVVRLKSGGYLVINQTEALVAIDVNSGKATRERNIELTARKTNLEAAEEAARQFRLRDLAGLIVIDFIDMEENRNNRAVEKKLKEALKNDRARIQVGRISNFGLLEMSRQRRRSGIVDGTTTACPTCAGAGAVRSHEMAALRILRAIESEAISGRAGTIVVKAALDVTLYMLNHKRAWLRRIEDDYAVSIEAAADEQKAGDQYELEKKGPPRKRAEQVTHVRADQHDPDEIEASDAETQADDAETSGDDDSEERPKRRRRRRRRSKKEAGSENTGASEADNESAGDGSSGGEAGDGEQRESADRGDDDEDRPKRRRRRGRRGGRRNARKKDASKDQADETGEQPVIAAEDGDAFVETSSTEADPAADGQPEPDDESPATESAAPDVKSAPADENGADQPANEHEREDANSDTNGAAADPADGDAVAAVPSAPSVAKKSKSTRKGWWQKAIGG